VLALAGGKPLTRLLDAVRRGSRVAFPNGVEPAPASGGACPSSPTTRRRASASSSAWGEPSRRRGSTCRLPRPPRSTGPPERTSGSRRATRWARSCCAYAAVRAPAEGSTLEHVSLPARAADAPSLLPQRLYGGCRGKSRADGSPLECPVRRALTRKVPRHQCDFCAEYDVRCRGVRDSVRYSHACRLNAGSGSASPSMPGSVRRVRRGEQ